MEVAGKNTNLTTGERIKNIYNKFGIVVILVVLFVVCWVIEPKFVSSVNIINVLTQTSVVAIIACSITMLIIAGNTDLAAGSMIALTGCICLGTFKNLTQERGMGDFLAALLSIGLTVLVSVAMYVLAALIITKFRAPAFIVTLAVSTAARGLVFLYSNGRVINTIGSIVVIGQGKLFNFLPYPVVVMIVIIIVSAFILKRTRMGRYLYAIGGNAEAATAAGINSSMVIIKSYIIHGIYVAIAGALFMARMNSGQPSEGVGKEFDAITGAIIGGASLAGGMGTIRGTIIGSFIVGIIGNILVLTFVQSYYQQIITGIIIVVAVILDIMTKGNKR